MQRDVCVSLVDVVTIRDFNLYAEVLEFIGGHDPAPGSKPPCLYAVTMRGRKRPGQRSVLESWFYPMEVGQRLPTLPVWLDVDLSVDLALESSYEETCRFLRISERERKNGKQTHGEGWGRDDPRHPTRGGEAVDR